MLIKKVSRLETRRFRIDLPRETWAELDQLEKDARQAGMSIDVTAALAESLTRMIGRARHAVPATKPHEKDDSSI